MTTSVKILHTYRCEFCGDERSYDWGLVDLDDGTGRQKCACLDCYEKLAETVTVVGS
jgi:hypothetical protein